MEGSSSIVTGLTSAFNTVANDCIEAVTAILPIGLTVAGMILVIGLGWKLFKRLTK